jgi:hypothetical protein
MAASRRAIDSAAPNWWQKRAALAGSLPHIRPFSRQLSKNGRLCWLASNAVANTRTTALLAICGRSPPGGDSTRATRNADTGAVLNGIHQLAQRCADPSIRGRGENGRQDHTRPCLARSLVAVLRNRRLGCGSRCFHLGLCRARCRRRSRRCSPEAPALTTANWDKPRGLYVMPHFARIVIMGSSLAGRRVRVVAAGLSRSTLRPQRAACPTVLGAKALHRSSRHSLRAVDRDRLIGLFSHQPGFEMARHLLPST